MPPPLNTPLVRSCPRLGLAPQRQLVAVVEMEHEFLWPLSPTNECQIGALTRSIRLLLPTEVKAVLFSALLPSFFYFFSVNTITPELLHRAW